MSDVKGWDFNCLHAVANPPRADRDTLDLAFRMEAKRSREAVAMERARIEAELLGIVQQALMVLRTRDNVPISDRQIMERANNLVCGLMGNFEIERLP